MIGRQLGSLRITNFLGQGRLGEVFRAEDLADGGRRVALKAIRPNGAGLPALSAGLERVVEEQRLLDHPAVLPFRRLVVDDDACWMVMDYYQASPLGRVVEPRGVAPVAHALGLFRSVVEAVAAAHRAGQVHGRLTPGQVLYGLDRRLRVTDFGLDAAAAGAERRADDDDAFVAPERRGGAPPTPAADVYSLGTLLFHVLVGRPPEAGGPPVVEQLRAVRPELTAPLQELVAATTADDPAARPRDASELLALLAAEPVVAGGLVPLARRTAPSAPVRATRTTKATEPKMADVPGGPFVLGSTASPNEQPPRRLDLAPFRIGRFPVTNREYAQLCAASGRPRPLDPPGWTDYFTAHPDHPVVQVTWHDATAYCQWLAAATGRAFRLPTEAEWEKAARGGLAEEPYPWGDAIPEDRALYAGTARPWSPAPGVATLPVGCFPSNGYGLHDVAGLVWEWCQDWYARYDATDERRRRGIYRVVRGGAWNSDGDALRTSFRMCYAPGYREPSIGFRLAEG